MSDNHNLTDFEGLAVRQAGIEIPGAAGGLREAMKIDPQEFAKGEVVHVVLECVVNKIRHDSIDKDDPTGDQRRVHIFNVENAAIIDGELVAERIAEQRDRIERAKEQAAGVARLPTKDELLRLEVEHEAGVHKILVAGCLDCDAEAEAEAEEAGEPTPITAR